MKLFTSLPPRDTKRFRDSWTRAGFRVVTVNSCNEDVVEIDDDLERIVVARDAAPFLGKPLVYFDDLMKVAAESGEREVFGVVNADIILDVGDDFIAFIREQARGGMVFGSRTEIDAPDARDGEMYIDGFDFFFIDPRIVPIYPPSDFCLGAPWWDYWTPLVPLLDKVPVKWLVTPVAYHISHPVAWHNDRHLDYGRELIRHLRGSVLAGRMGAALQLPTDATGSHADLYPFSQDVCRFIREQAEHIFYPATPNLQKMAVIGKERYRQLLGLVREMESERAAMGDCLRECYVAREEAERVAAEKDRRLTAIEASVSWRATAPCRWLADRLLMRRKD
jgi:hypothetical protein